jgi:hypothetical protein
MWRLTTNGRIDCATMTACDNDCAGCVGKSRWHDDDRAGKSRSCSAQRSRGQCGKGRADGAKKRRADGADGCDDGPRGRRGRDEPRPKGTARTARRQRARMSADGRGRCSPTEQRRLPMQRRASPEIGGRGDDGRIDQTEEIPRGEKNGSYVDQISLTLT